MRPGGPPKSPTTGFGPATAPERGNECAAGTSTGTCCGKQGKFNAVPQLRHRERAYPVLVGFNASEVMTGRGYTICAQLRNGESPQTAAKEFGLRTCIVQWIGERHERPSPMGRATAYGGQGR